MRRLMVAFGAVLLASVAATSAAQAQAWTDGECTVSLWWPYSREPGDCLTDGERRAGATGTYRDPDGIYMRTPVAARALVRLEGCDATAAPEPNLVSISERIIVRGTGDQAVTATGTDFRCNTQAYFNAVPIPTRVVSATELDILIPQELADRDGNYPIVLRNRAPNAVAALGNAGAPVAGNAQAGGDSSGFFSGIFGGDDEPTAPGQPRVIENERGCNTHLLWPYVRRPGDCLTDAEREAGMVGVYGDSRPANSAAPEPVPGAANVAPLPASSGSSGLFGLFGSDPGFGGGGLLDDNLLPPEQQGQ